ncbi:MAG: response regulator, partial [Planctomycetes bacterium]|nr:response regulator [Planctomycetota bacterium]
IRMPVMDGLEATRQIRTWEEDEGRERVPIVAITAYSMHEEIQNAIEAGCDYHLVKPVSRESLGEVFEEFWPEDGDDSKESISENGTICVKADAQLQNLIPQYLEKRQGDLQSFKDFLTQSAFKEIQALGHKIKGSGGGYGFYGLSEIGAKLEANGRAKNLDQMQNCIDELEDYLNRVEVSYE